MSRPGRAATEDPEIEIDYERSTITCDDKEFSFSPLSTVAQELVIAGGAENQVKQRLNSLASSPS